MALQDLIGSSILTNNTEKVSTMGFMHLNVLVNLAYRQDNMLLAWTD